MIEFCRWMCGVWYGGRRLQLVKGLQACSELLVKEESRLESGYCRRGLSRKGRRRAAYGG